MAGTPGTDVFGWVRVTTNARHSYLIFGPMAPPTWTTLRRRRRAHGRAGCVPPKLPRRVALPALEDTLGSGTERCYGALRSFDDQQSYLRAGACTFAFGDRRESGEARSLNAALHRTHAASATGPRRRMSHGGRPQPPFTLPSLPSTIRMRRSLLESRPHGWTPSRRQPSSLSKILSASAPATSRPSQCTPSPTLICQSTATTDLRRIVLRRVSDPKPRLLR